MPFDPYLNPEKFDDPGYLEPDDDDQERDALKRCMERYWELKIYEYLVECDNNANK